MDSKRPMEDKIVIEKLAVITFDDVVSEPAFRRYLIRSWESLTKGLNNGSTILFIGGVHGDDKGKLGPRENIQTLKNQVRILQDLPFSIEQHLQLNLNHSSSQKFLMLIGC